MHSEKHLKGPNSAKFQFWICTRTSKFLFFEGYKRRFLGGDARGKLFLSGFHSYKSTINNFEKAKG